MAAVQVLLLDGETLELSLDRKSKGEELFEKVCDHLNLVERDYFGLIYEEKGDPRNWLELDKRLSKFFKAEPWKLSFEVKFYPPDPTQLQEDITRYQLCLQVRNDILSGKLACSFVTHAMLGSYLVQSELGDFNSDEYTDTSYLKDFRFSPNQTPELESKVMELHKQHKGQTPSEAELHYLENAKKLAMYGVDLHPAKDSEGVNITIGVCSTGLLVYNDKLRINRFAWPKILKIAYKRNYFYVKIRPGEYEQYEQTIGFKLPSHRAAKKLWRVSVEHHTFFRLTSPDATVKPGILPKLSSNFRYSRRTQFQTKQIPIDREQPSFQRTLSSRKIPVTRSLDPLHQQNNEANKEPNKRHTMPHPPSRVPGLDSSPAKKDKKPLGGVAVLPTDGFVRKEKRESKLDEKTNGIGNESDDEKENREMPADRESQKSPDRTPADKKSKSKSPGGGFSIFSKSPKKSGSGKEEGGKDGQTKDGKDRDGQDRDSGRDSTGDTDLNRMNVFKTGKDKKNKKSKDKSGKGDKNGDDKGSGGDGTKGFGGDGTKGSGGDGTKGTGRDGTKGSGGDSQGAGGKGSGDSAKKGSGDEKLESLGFTREYVYEETEDEKKRRALKNRGFSYEMRGSKSEDELEENQRSPVRQNIGIAFNYSPTKRESSVDERSVDDVGHGGQLVGKDGQLVGKDGRVVGKDGQLVGKDGQVVGKDGLLVGKDGQLVGKDGRVVGKDGQLVGKDGQVVGKDGQLVGKDGQLVGKDGQLVGKDGRLVGKDGQLIGKEGSSAGKDGKTTGKEGRSGKDRRSTASADSASTAESEAFNKSQDGDKHFMRGGFGSLFKKKEKDPSSVSLKDDKSKKSKSDKDKKGNEGAKSDKKRQDSSSSSSSSDSSDDGEDADKKGAAGAKKLKSKKEKTKKDGSGKERLSKRDSSTSEASGIAGKDTSGKDVSADKDGHKEGSLFGLKLKLGRDKAKADGEVKTGKGDSSASKGAKGDSPASKGAKGDSPASKGAKGDSPASKDGEGDSSFESSLTGKSDTSPGKADKTPSKSDSKAKKEKTGGLFGFDSIGKSKKVKEGDDKGRKKLEERALGKEAVSSTETLEAQGSPGSVRGATVAGGASAGSDTLEKKDKDKKKGGGGIFASFERRPKSSPEKKDVPPSTDKGKSKIPVADKRGDGAASPDKNKEKKSFFTFKPNLTKDGKDKGKGGDVASGVSGGVESLKYSSTVSGSPSVIGDSPKSSTKLPSAVITEDPSAMFLNAERLGSPTYEADRSFDSMTASLVATPASSFAEQDRSNASITEERTSGPKIVKTTTKQSVVKNKGNVTHNIEEKVEDLSTGDFTVNTQTNTAESLEGLDPYVTATAVTTRTATTTEDLGTNAKTSQVEEKTVARTTTQTGTRQEKRVVTQEVRATSTIVSADPPMIERRDSMSSTSSDDSGTPIDDDRGVYYTNMGSITYQEPIVETEPILVRSPQLGDDSVTLTSTRDVPLVETAQAVVLPLGENSFTLSGEIVSSQTITSKTRTVETVTYKTEKDGVVETRVEQKITIQSDGDPIDHDKALAEAIQEATAMNPDMQVEKIEIQQESLP